MRLRQEIVTKENLQTLLPQHRHQALRHQAQHQAQHQARHQAIVLKLILKINNKKNKHMVQPKKLLCNWRQSIKN